MAVPRRFLEDLEAAYRAGDLIGAGEASAFATLLATVPMAARVLERLLWVDEFTVRWTGLEPRGGALLT